MLNLRTAAIAPSEDETAQTLHLAIFGDAIDQDELDFITEFADLTTAQAERAYTRALLASDDFEASYGATSSEAFVRTVVFNLFDRNATLNELDRWTTALDAGADRAVVVQRILNRASEIDTEAYRAKLAIANYVTAQEAVGGYVPEDLTRQDLRSNEELWFDLMQLDAASDNLALEVIGESLGGRPIHAATVGTGEVELVYITQIHGDEPIATEGAMMFLDFLSGDSAEAAAIRENVTLTTVVRANPDGFERWEQEVGGVRGLIDPRRNDANLDLNRTYDPEDPYSEQFAPESNAVKDLVRSIDPAMVVDFHNQGNYRDETDGSLDTMSVLWPTNPDVDPAVADEAKRAIVSLADAMEDFDYTELSLYPRSDTRSVARNGFALEGQPAMLVEQRFLQEMSELALGLDVDYSALVSVLALEAFVAMKGIAEAYADGSVFTNDPALAEAIPERSPSIDYADLYSDDRYVPEDTILV